MKEKTFYVEIRKETKAVTIKEENGWVNFYYNKEGGSYFYSLMPTDWCDSFEAHLFKKNWFTEEMAKYITKELKKDGSSKKHSE